MNLSSALGTAGSVYVKGGSGTGGPNDNTGNSYAITTGGTGAFTAGNIGVSGSSGVKAFNVGSALESAQAIAAAQNLNTSSTNVTAIADTSAAFIVTSGSFTFKIGNGTDAAQTNAATITATVTAVTPNGLSPLVQAINAQTGQTGITASVDANNHLILTQNQGDNITFTGFAGTGTLKAGGSTTVTLAAAGTTVATVQGLVSFESTQSFALDSVNATNIGLKTTSALSSLSQVNVSTVGGANAALNSVDFAIQQLENVGGQLGATQQRLQATVSNLQTTASNLTTAQGVVQDANIPQVTTQLTQQQILQQAGVSALAQSSALQQSFLKLLG